MYVERAVVSGMAHKLVEIEIATEKRAFPVKLGKFRSTSNEKARRGKYIGETCSTSLDARRFISICCFSCFLS